jgi:hypothetical protein
MARIYLAALFLRGACAPQRRLFYKTFGLSAQVNKENMKVAMKAGLDVLAADYYGRLRRNNRSTLGALVYETYRAARMDLVTEGYLYDFMTASWVKKEG